MIFNLDNKYELAVLEVLLVFLYFTYIKLILGEGLHLHVVHLHDGLIVILVHHQEVALLFTETENPVQGLILEEDTKNVKCFFVFKFYHCNNVSYLLYML